MTASREALDIDLYQARMLIGFHRAGMDNKIGTMEAFVRKLPNNRNFLVACGIERIVDYLRELQIKPQDVRLFKEILPEIEFDEALGNYLTSLDFTTLKVRAMKEGEIAFANEPLISVSGPIGMAQFIEKKVLSILNHDVRIASKAARITIAARGRPIAEFGGRRGADKMSPEIGRAAYIGGFSSTSNVLCYQMYGVPCIGTMGHVWVMAYESEDEAYDKWSKQFPNSTYLPDTYHVYNGVEKVLAKCSGNIGGIRFDSGDILQNSIEVRRELNDRNHRKVQLGATNDLNEYKINDLLNNGAPIDWFGVGTEVVSTPDAPTCSFIYKLVEIDNRPVAKIAADGKGTMPGAKQVFRFKTPSKWPGDTDVVYTHDVLGLATDVIDAEPKLVSIDLNSERMSPSDAVKKARDYFLEQLAMIPQNLRLINDLVSTPYSVSLSDKLLEVNIKFVNDNNAKTVWGRRK